MEPENRGRRARRRIRSRHAAIRSGGPCAKLYLPPTSDPGRPGECKRRRPRVGQDRRLYLTHAALEFDRDFHRSRRIGDLGGRPHKSDAELRACRFAVGAARLCGRRPPQCGEHRQDRRRDFRAAAADVERSAGVRPECFLYECTRTGAVSGQGPMKAHVGLSFAPQLVTVPTGRLRAAVLVRPGATIENASPLIGEPGAIYARALEQHGVLRRTLEYFGVETTVLEPHGDDPYQVAAADAAVAFADGAALMRLTAMSRRAEVDRLETQFARL